MKQLLATLLGILLLSASSFSISYSQSLKTSGPPTRPAQQRQRQPSQLIEQFSFSLPDFKMDHQGESNKLNISISYQYVINITNSEYPDFRWLAKDVETLLNNYPNKDDYWEIVNKQVTSLLLKKYPAITSITSEFAVAPSRGVPYSRSSRVTRSRPRVRTNRNQL